jgi:uncharacterized membrane protein YccC
MFRISRVVGLLRSALQRHKLQLALCVRVTVAAAASAFFAQLMHLPLYLWAVLTAVVLTQVSFGRSLKATADYVIGTLGGVFYAGAIGLLVPHSDEVSLLAALALAVAPVTLLAAIKPAFTVAPVTAVMVILSPTLTHLNPMESALYRLQEVLLGGTVALLVSLLVFPARAHDLTIETAARMLDLLAHAVRELLAGFTRGLDAAAIEHIQNRLGAAFTELEMIGAEAKRERLHYFQWGPDQGPLVRTSLRLRHDLLMIGRAATEPLPQSFQSRLGPRLETIAAAASGYLSECAVSLLEHSDAPSFDATARAIAAFTAELESLREEGSLRSLRADTVERIFALGFALEQMRLNFGDLQRCITESAHLHMKAPSRPSVNAV